MKRHLFYTFLVIFVVTTAVTLLGVTGVVQIADGYLKFLVGAFLSELAIAVIGLFTRTDFYAEDYNPKQTDTIAQLEQHNAALQQETARMAAENLAVQTNLQQQIAQMETERSQTEDNRTQNHRKNISTMKALDEGLTNALKTNRRTNS